MHQRDVRQADLGINQLLRIFAALAVLLLVALAAAPARSHFSEWRAVQERYNALARARGLEPIALGIQQIWKPELDLVDRCTSCHLGMGEAAPIDGDPLFGAHPAIPHEARQMGCTVCHGGQGRATSRAAAHGLVPHWEEPLLERAHFDAGCGSCHSHLVVAPATAAASGRALFEKGCRGCHANDLATVGLRGVEPRWHDQHVERAAKAPAPPAGGATPAFEPLADEEIALVDAYLRTLVGAPRLLEAKALAHRLGCRGCHQIDGVGGDDGPDLSRVGRKSLADLDFSRVRGERTLDGWLREHFLDPARIVPGSQMPDLGLSAEQADLLTLYMLSLRSRPVDERLAPRDRVRGLRLGERDFAVDGESLYGVFCAACHGERGAGRRFGASDVAFPAIGSSEFLALADDAFLRHALERGRAGRRMPAWGQKRGGLRRQELDAIVAYLRGLEPPAPSLEAVLAAEPDLALGRRLYAADCAGCHGRAGDGGMLAPPLAAPDNPATKEDSRMYGTLTVGIAGTAMGSFRRYDAARLRAVIAFVRALAPVAHKREGWVPGKGRADRGAELYLRHCKSCHGEGGAGAAAPAIGGKAFLAAASDGYLVATIVRGRGDSAMPHFGSATAAQRALEPAEVADVVAYLRSLEPKETR